MKTQKGFLHAGHYSLLAICVLFGAVIVLGIATNKKQAEDQRRFMVGCLQDKKQYECDVLWAQTNESKQNRDFAIAVGTGLAIGAAAGRK